MKIITRYIFLNLCFITFALILTTCEWFSSTEPKPLPPGYQFEIPWPSLADSPWPMNHHDPQNTGRTKFLGPQEGAINWIYNRGHQNGTVVSGIALDREMFL